jgi:hypothetical protein
MGRCSTSVWKIYQNGRCHLGSQPSARGRRGSRSGKNLDGLVSEKIAGRRGPEGLPNLNCRCQLSRARIRGRLPLIHRAAEKTHSRKPTVARNDERSSISPFVSVGDQDEPIIGGVYATQVARICCNLLQVVASQFPENYQYRRFRPFRHFRSCSMPGRKFTATIFGQPRSYWPRPYRTVPPV